MAVARNTAISDSLVQGLDALRVGIAVFDTDDRLVFCNQHYRYIYRSFASVDELIGLEFEEILWKLVRNHEIAGREVIDHPEGWIARRLAGHQAQVPEPILERLTDGRWFEIKERRLPDGCIIGIWQDETERQQSHMRLSDALASAADGLVLWDQRDRLLLCNDLFVALCCESPPPRRGDSLPVVVRRFAEHTLDHSEFGIDYLVETWMEQHALPAGSHVVRHRDGRWLLVRQRRSRDGGAVTVLSDITELKNREQELILRGQSLEDTVHELEMVQHKLERQAAQAIGLAEQLDMAKREVEQSNLSKTGFLRIISHELRTPLHAIIGFAELLSDERLGPIGNPAYAEYAGDIRASGEHLLSLVNQLLDLSRIDAGRYDLALAHHDIAEVIADALRIVGKQARDAKITLTSRLADGLPRLRIDEQAVRQVLVNLLSNAVKFTPADGEITVETSQDGPWTTITVCDSGIGIPEDVLPRLMRPFERNDNELNRRNEGTGLGLAISKALIDLHGGSLEIESALGQGTTATIRLPSADAEESEMPSKAAS